MMACAAVGVHGSTTAMAMDHRREGMRTDLSGMRRSQSAPQLRCTLSVARAVALPPSLKTSRSVGVFPLGSILTNTIRSFLFDSEQGEEAAPAGEEMRLVEPAEESDEEATANREDNTPQEKRANWVARIMELRRRWRDRQQKEEQEEGGGEGEEEDDSYCGVSYDSENEDEEGNPVEWDQESFARLLGSVPLSEAKLFAQLSFLCNKAYEIPDIKEDELRSWYKLDFVTSSLEKKWEAAVRAKLETDSTRPPRGLPASGPPAEAPNNTPIRPSRAYKVAASAASYVHSREKGLLSPHGQAGSHADGSEKGKGEAAEASGPDCCGYNNPEVAAYMAATTMTAVVAAEEEARQEAAKDLRSLHSSPCEWFVCDNESSCTRCFVIQGSDSLASWQANLFFEPTKFETMEVLVHRGIYEAAKGIYEQFLPEIQEHLNRYGDDARFRFTGHSLGGSLCLLVALMLLARGDVKHCHLHAVVTFGSPSVFCGGQKVLEELGLDEEFVRSVMMHRDIVPRAFSCDYPNHVAQLLKRLNGAFRSHPCLNNQKVLYSPLGKTYILQPDEQSSPFHPLLPPGAALYVLDGKSMGGNPSKAAIAGALRTFINSPHPLETLSDRRAYGSEGTILRDHDSSNYARAMAGLVRQHTNSLRRRSRKHRLELWWPLLTTPAAIPPLPSCRNHQNPVLRKPALVTNEVGSGF
ncbi:hypothetical protein Cni_G11892 [Canna indica]|uniref:Fungal lipase-type domain-containing protein n=1 Tax=Canna indica TaxID=4628 RepID=A0AAQ3K6U8_9LILI|nr:hypothetical protein Cni_G11892 [Canna indica]